VGLDRNDVRFWSDRRRNRLAPSSRAGGFGFDEDERRDLLATSGLRDRLMALLLASAAGFCCLLWLLLRQAFDEIAAERRGGLLAVGLGGGFLLVSGALGFAKLYVAPLLTLTEQTLSRLRSTQRRSGYELALARCALHELLRVSVDLFEPSARDKGLKLELVIAPDLPRAVQLDAARVQQVLANLIHNAIKFTETGGVKIQVDAINLTEQRFDLRVRVEDTGIGVRNEARSALFDAFARPSEGSPRLEAAGLGLSISKQLVRLMHGQIARLDGPGPGSVFQFVIPVTRLVEPSISPSAPPAEPQLLLLRLPSPTAPILIVDDEEPERRLAIELLEDLGFEAEATGGGARAIELVSQGKYALILMDCQMPELDGYTSARRIRALDAPQNGVPIIACAARGSCVERSEVLAAGMDDTLMKPLGRAALGHVLARWLSDEKNPASSGLRLTEAATRKAGNAGAVPDDLTLDLLPLRRSERLVDLFVTQVPAELRAIALSVEAGRADDVRACAHKLKGMCQSSGAMKMVALCATLEHAEGLSKAALTSQVKALGEAFSLVLTLLGEERPKSERATAPSSREPYSEL
jgi:CheY-like chemotaxis protein